MINKDDIEKIREIYENLESNCNESTVGERVVISFLELLGFKKEWGIPEKNITSKDTCDRFIESPNGDKLIVEMKRKNHVIDDEDKKQILRYINKSVVEWGILTNGNEYFLVNHMLNDLEPVDRYCLRFNLICEKFHPISKHMNDLFLNYFTYDAIFNKKSSIFFSEFQRFKVKSLNNNSIMSIKQYESANYNFFDYITKKIDYTTISLNDLNSRNIVTYFKHLLTYKTLDSKTILNKFRYIKSFVDFLEKEDRLSNKNDFTRFACDDLIKELNLKIEKKVTKSIDIDQIKLLLDSQKNDPKNGLRNTLIIQLICYLALSREDIINITYNVKNPNKSDLKRNKKTYTLKINGYDIKLPQTMTKNLDDYIKQRKKDNIKFQNLFYNQYTMNDNKFKPLTYSTIAQILNYPFNKSNNSLKLNYSLLRSSIIKIMYENNFSIEEISKITLLSVDTIFKSLANTNTFSTKIDKLPNKIYNSAPLNNIIF